MSFLKIKDNDSYLISVPFVDERSVIHWDSAEWNSLKMVGTGSFTQDVTHDVKLINLTSEIY